MPRCDREMHPQHKSVQLLAGRTLGFHLAVPCFPATLPTSFFLKLLQTYLASVGRRVQQLALIGLSSSLHSEACNALGVSDGVIHSRIS